MKQRAIKSVTVLREYKIGQAKAAAERRLAEALSIPEIAKAHADYVNLRFKAALKKSENEAEADNALNAYKSALKAHGFDEREFEYAPLCPICGDAGVKDGKVCQCVWSDYIAALKKVCEIEKKATFTFADCNFDGLDDEKQKDTLKSFYAFMEQYSQKLPAVKLKNIVFTGGTGTGKTCLASAVARNAVEHGKSCKFLSAFEFNNEMLSAHTSPIAERAHKMRDILTADLLVIDDLGVEPIYKNVTVEYLLLVLEERTRAGLCTLITTNLDDGDLQTKYGDRICSRLLDKKHSRIAAFVGKDLRLL
ncbi:MAG: ATP-binding protein [Bacteroides sp.]|nr:ATP-binding protein [Bacillota bacterium]MCM1455974.1 ATP-binding protein [Bacteroides sp.]